MNLSSVVRRTSLAGAGALAVATLVVVAPPAVAAPVFVDNNTVLSSTAGAGVNSGGCTPTVAPATESPAVQVVENGPAAGGSASVSATATNPVDPADTASMSAQATSAATVTSAAGNPSLIDLAVSGTANISTALAASACEHFVYAGSELEFRFTVTQPGFLHLTTRAASNLFGSIRLESNAPNNELILFEGSGLKFSGSHAVFLPAGLYTGRFGAYMNPEGTTTKSASGTVTVHGEFVVAGSQTEAVSGKGKRYVALPSARSCANHTVEVSVTGKKKRAAQIKTVTFFVNDKRVKKVKTPKKRAAVSLPAADDQAVDVRAEVKLFPARNGRPAKVLRTTAGYEACS